MTKQVQFRRGTTAQHASFTGALAEITVDTDKKVAVVHDGSTQGGQEMVGRTATQTLTNKTLSTPSFTGNPILGDNVILHFGSATASTGDLQVKSDGTTSTIEERTSALRIYSNDLYLQDYTNAKIYLRAQASGSVQLYHNNSIKLETSSTGATVTGTLSATALSTGAAGAGVNIDNAGTITGPATITIDPAAIGNDTGKVSIKGDLEVLGTTTTINSTVSVIADPIIELRKGTSITAADGGVQVNLTTDGAGAVTGYQRLQWNNTSTRWETTDGTTAKPIVNTVDAQTIAGNKTFSNNLTASGSNAAIQFSPTGTGSVTINPATAGTINNMSIGATTKASGAFTTLAVKDTSANFDVSFVPTSSTALTANRNLTFDVVNAARTIKLAGNLDLANNFTTSGNFAVTLTSTNTTSVTLPTSGTLATLGNAETFTGVKTFTPTARTSGSASYFTITTPADITLAASTESIGSNFTAATRQFATGALTTQRERVFDAPTYAFVGASTLTTAINVDIAEPVQGTNATITNRWALRAGRSLFTGAVTFQQGFTTSSSGIAVNGSTSGTTTLVSESTASGTLTLPSETGTVATQNYVSGFAIAMGL